MVGYLIKLDDQILKLQTISLDNHATNGQDTDQQWQVHGDGKDNKYGTNHMIVLVLHAFVFGLLMYYSSKYFFDDAYKWLEKKM